MRIKNMRALFALLLCLPLAAVADTLFIAEFRGAPPTSVYYQAVSAPAVTTQAVSITGVSAQSAAFNAQTGIIRVYADVACRVLIGGTNPTATVNSMPLSEGQTEYFVVKAGDKLAVILTP